MRKCGATIGLMPGKDGFRFACPVRADPTLISTRMLLATSSGRGGDAARCRAPGVSAYLLKPESERALLEILEVEVNRLSGELTNPQLEISRPVAMREEGGATR